MSYIFVSYAHSDTQKIIPIVGSLLDIGYPVWQDSLNLRGGSEWANEIDTAIENASYFLLIWSSNVLGSSYVLDKEIPHAKQHDTKIIPIIISGDIDDMPDDLRALQVIDLRKSFSDGMREIQNTIPLLDNITPTPRIAHQLQKTDATFSSAQRQWQTSLDFQVNDTHYVGLLLERSKYDVKSYLLGQIDDTFRKPDAVQLYIQMTGNVAWNTFDEYLRFVHTNDMRVWTILVRGFMRPAQRGDGLEYYLPTQHPNDADIWQNIVQVAWDGVQKVSDSNTPLHVFIQGPVALGTAFGAYEHLKRQIYIYHQDRGATSDAKRYFKAFDYRF